MVQKKFIVVLVIVVVICGGVYIFKTNQKENVIYINETITNPTITENTENIEFETETENIELKVYVCGAVNNSKVVTLEKGSRIIDALELAGGATEEAELDNINLAALVEDSQRIYVPKKGEDIDKDEFTVQNNNVSDDTASDIVNINKATKSELQTLDGIGETIAQYIIDYRSQNGAFKSIDEIKNVTRVGDKTFEKIKNKITVGN